MTDKTHIGMQNQQQ